ncbi:Uncharacterised protein [Vibrio cholerae]|nr:Uncharacterised protein [Vibrio cholerae]
MSMLLGKLLQLIQCVQLSCITRAPIQVDRLSFTLREAMI